MIERKKIILILCIVCLFSLFFYFDLGQHLTLDNIKSKQQQVLHYYQANPVIFALGYFLIYVVMAAISIPGAALMTLIAGSIFGLLWGSIIVSFASTIGASLAFLIARYLFKDFIQNRYEKNLTRINRGIEQEGAYYLFTLRLVPAFPFFIINLVMGITTIPVGIFYVVSQLGMLPATIIYVNAGKQLASIESLSGILSPPIVFAFVLLGLFPIVVKKLLAVIQSRKQHVTNK